MSMILYLFICMLYADENTNILYFEKKNSGCNWYRVDLSERESFLIQTTKGCPDTILLDKQENIIALYPKTESSVRSGDYVCLASPLHRERLQGAFGSINEPLKDFSAKSISETVTQTHYRIVDGTLQLLLINEDREKGSEPYYISSAYDVDTSIVLGVYQAQHYELQGSEWKKKNESAIYLAQTNYPLQQMTQAMINRLVKEVREYSSIGEFEFVIQGKKPRVNPEKKDLNLEKMIAFFADKPTNVLTFSIGAVDPFSFDKSKNPKWLNTSLKPIEEKENISLVNQEDPNNSWTPALTIHPVSKQSVFVSNVSSMAEPGFCTHEFVKPHLWCTNKKCTVLDKPIKLVEILPNRLLIDYVNPDASDIRQALFLPNLHTPVITFTSNETAFFWPSKLGSPKGKKSSSKSIQQSPTKP